MTAHPEAVAAAQPHGAARKRATSAVAALLIKELADHLHGRRFFVGAGVCILLFALTGFIRLQDLRNAQQERNAFLQRWSPSVEEQIDRDEAIQVENTRSVSALSILSVGLEPITPFRFTSTKEGLRFGEARGARNTIDALFGYLDLTFVVGVLLSLLAIALTFDAICGERSQGTLAVLLSYPVRRSTVLLVKVLSSMIVLTVCFLPAFFGVMLTTGAVTGNVMNGSHWALYALLTLLYLLVFVCAGLAVSSVVRRPADAALICLAVWVALVFVAPRAVGIVVNMIHPPTRAVALMLKEDELLSQLRSANRRDLQKAFESFLDNASKPTAQEDFSKARKQAIDDFHDKRRQLLARIWDEQDREEAQREKQIERFSLVTPTAMFNHAAAELSWTGYQQRKHFIDQSRVYDQQIGRKLAESRQSFFAPTGGGRGNAMVTKDDVRPYLIPFESTWAASRDIVQTTWLPLLMLAMFAAFFFTIGYIGFL
ncbi:MAG TPA: ABC transporter permease subunit, partial [Thermoanaerobaculia bacterium]|nr:ABC transporter permease subunit [Thermoanaerobaculia bacterium]